MRVFHCDQCDQLVFFENSVCVSCGARLAFHPDTRDMTVVPRPAAPPPATATAPLTPAPDAGFRRCRNDLDFDVCNWVIPAGDAHELCASCRLTAVIPDTSIPANVTAWYRLETAKRRLVFTLLALGLPVVNRIDDPAAGLSFAFMADPEDPAAPRVLTGHAGGIITINIAEADDAEREKRRQGLGEPYRTLLGHMRHESGHYYWDRLIKDSAELDGFRERFGDDTADYGQALARHYEQGAPADWQARFVSAYASAHPWEDWAETWAHYLHMVDTLETAGENGLILKPRRRDEPAVKALPPEVVTSGRVPFERLIDTWYPLTYVVNNLNRGLGLSDGYPFVLSTPAVDKLRFVHDVVARASAKVTAP